MKKLIYLTVLIILSSCTQKDGYELFRDKPTPQYEHEFVVEVGFKYEGRIDSVKIIINGKYSHDEIPFYYGTNKVPERYDVTALPDYDGYAYTRVFHKGVLIDKYEHYNGEKGVLTGTILKTN